MSKARDLAGLLGGGESGVATFSGTGAIQVPGGTTAQRPGTPVVGMVRYNSSSGVVEQYNAQGWQGIDNPPVVTSYSGVINTDTTTTITISGSGFKNGAVVYIDGAAVENVQRALTTSYVNSSTLTATTGASDVNYVGNASFDIIVVNPTGLSSALASAGLVDRDPVWTTGAGNIAEIYDGYDQYSPIATLVATDPDGDTISYSVSSGALPTSSTLNSSTGAISGQPAYVTSSTTYTFEVTATASQQAVPRTFNIIVNPAQDGATSGRAATSALALYDFGIRDDGVYWIDVNGTPTQLHCLLSSTFVGGFYAANQTKAGWTQFAQRVNSIGDVNVLTDTGTPDTNGTTNWAIHTFKDYFDTNALFSTETEVLIDIDGTHTFVFDGYRGISKTLAQSQIDILRGYTGSYNFLSESSWNSLTATSNTQSGCSSCYRPQYKYFNSSYAQIQTNQMSQGGGESVSCSDWCASGYGKIWSRRISPTLQVSGGCYDHYGGGTSCTDISVAQTGSVAKLYFRQRPL